MGEALTPTSPSFLLPEPRAQLALPAWMDGWMEGRSGVIGRMAQAKPSAQRFSETQDGGLQRKRFRPQSWKPSLLGGSCAALCFSFVLCEMGTMTGPQSIVLGLRVPGGAGGVVPSPDAAKAGK